MYPYPPYPFRASSTPFRPVIHSAPTFRGLAAVLAVMVGLTWGAPIAQAACLSAQHCGDSMPTEHCQWGESSALCLTHHASQEAVQTQTPSVDSLPSVETSSIGTQLNSTFPTVDFRRPWFRCPIVCAHRRHAQVGVWLE